MSTPAVRLHESITVDRDPAGCFRFVADFANIRDWDPGVVDATKTSDGPVGLGTRYTVTVRSGGRRIPMQYRITTYTPDTQVVLTGTSDAVDAVDTIAFTPTATGTRIDYTADLTLKTVSPAVARIMGPLLDRVGRRAIGGLYAALQPANPPRRRLLRDLGDKLLVPGMLQFTRLGAGRQAIADHLIGQRVVITGATSGLGAAAAERLATLGADLVLVGRNNDKLADTCEGLIRRTGHAAITTEQADLESPADVARLTDRLLAMGTIDVLINNAGALFNTRQTTADGLERSFAVNLLAPYALMRGLRPALRVPGGRVVNVASGGMYLQALDVGDLQFARPDYDGTRAYAQAKRALVALTRKLADDWSDDGIAVHAMHPGWADTPGVAESLPGFKRVMGHWLRTPEDGADTMVWLAACPAAAACSGAFWLDRAPHTTDVLPGTRVSADDAAAVQVQLDALLDDLIATA